MPFADGWRARQADAVARPPGYNFFGRAGGRNFAGWAVEVLSLAGATAGVPLGRLAAISKRLAGRAERIDEEGRTWADRRAAST